MLQNLGIGLHQEVSLVSNPTEKSPNLGLFSPLQMAIGTLGDGLISSHFHYSYYAFAMILPYAKSEIPCHTATITNAKSRYASGSAYNR